MPRRWGGFVLRFIVAFAGASFLFSLLSWGHINPSDRMPEPTASLAFHMGVHGLFGAAAALPSRRVAFIVAGALGAMLLDVDHLGFVLGWPVPGRASHSMGFMLGGPLVLAELARRGYLGRTVSPLMCGGLSLAIVLSHLAWDAFLAGAKAPLLLPIAGDMIVLTTGFGIVLEATAVATMVVVSRTGDERR